MTKQRYVVGIDGSEWAHRALRRAIELAKDTNAEVDLVGVIDWSGHEALTLDELAHRKIDKLKEHDEFFDKSFAPLLKEYTNSGVTLNHKIMWGKPTESIHRHIKDSKATMVFVGRRGRSALLNIVTGSTAVGLSHLTGVPIVLVP